MPTDHPPPAPDDLAAFTRQVRRNCDISDARNAGLFSVCGLALRLRDLFKWDQDLPPWEEREAGEVLAWIGRKEEAWTALAEAELGPLPLGRRRYEPFATDRINARLESAGLFYGAGYAHSLKPTFFLAVLEEVRAVDGQTVRVLGRELARDLLTLPALTQDGGVVLRREAARLFFWDQLTYVKPSGRAALDFALQRAGVPDASPARLRGHLDRLLSIQEVNYIQHEVGELREAVLDRATWRAIVAGFPHTPVELLARALKDLLADTGPGGTLARILADRDAVSLGFYTAFADGMAREAFPGLAPAFLALASRGDWGPLEDAAAAAHRTAAARARRLMEIFREGEARGDRAWSAGEIRRRLLEAPPAP
jgi:hypothetical protein